MVPVDETDVATASPGPLRGSVEGIEKLPGTSPVTSYKIGVPLGSVADEPLSPGSKSDTQCVVPGVTQLGDRPGLAVGANAITDIVATCK